MLSTLQAAAQLTGFLCPTAPNSFLLEGDVFTQDFIDTYIDCKKINEVDPVQMRPHPYEFTLYYDF